MKVLAFGEIMLRLKDSAQWEKPFISDRCPECGEQSELDLRHKRRIRFYRIRLLLLPDCA